MPLINKSDYPYPLRTINGELDVSSIDVTATTINATLSQGFGRTPTFELLTSGSGTYTSPSQAVYHIVEMVGGGGGAGCCSTNSVASGGGGAGGYLKFMVSAGSYSYSVGTGGAGASVINTAGAAGTSSTFGTFTAPGGAGSGGSNRDTSGGSGGTPSLANLNASISASWGGGGLAGYGNLSGTGGASHFSGETRSFNQTGLLAGENGALYGGGGGGSLDQQKGGDGAAGCILVSTFY